MKNMIFGIGPNPNYDKDEDEDEFECSPFWVYITDKQTWDEKKCCNDNVNDDIKYILEEHGFEESMESVFESTMDFNNSEQDICLIMEGLNFVRDKDFEYYMKNSL